MKPCGDAYSKCYCELTPLMWNHPGGLVLGYVLFCFAYFEESFSGQQRFAGTRRLQMNHIQTVHTQKD